MIPEPAIEQEAKWPPDLAEECRRRIYLLNRIKKSKSLLNLTLAHCRNNPVDFINDWVWTYDPRPAGEGGLTTLPFLMFPKQVEFIRWLQGRLAAQDDGLCEKSRELGVSWLCMAFAVWMWLFVPGSSIGFGSRKEQLVDQKGVMDSLFEKGRFILEMLPREFMPTGWDSKAHMPYMKIVSPDKTKTITGEAGDNIGRGGRKSIYFKDESAHYDRPMKIEASLSQNTNVQIDVSSVNGPGNPFHTKRMKWGSTNPERLFIFDWRDDPRKDQAWYDDQLSKRESVVIAQEIDRDYGASQEGVVIPGRWVQAAARFVMPGSGAKIAALDVADDGLDAKAFFVRHGHTALHICQWKDSGATEAGRKAKALAQQYGAEILRFEKEGVGAAVSGVGRDSKDDTPVFQGVSPGSTTLKGWYIAPSKGMKGKKNSDMFLNLKSMTWWNVRERFRKTWEVVNDIKKYPNEELISLASLTTCKAFPFLISELSQPTWTLTESGKIKINKKPKGTSSPNLADDVIISYMESNKFKGVW